MGYSSHCNTLIPLEIDEMVVTFRLKEATLELAEETWRSEWDGELGQGTRTALQTVHAAAMNSWLYGRYRRSDHMGHGWSASRRVRSEPSPGCGNHVYAAKPSRAQHLYVAENIWQSKYMEHKKQGSRTWGLCSDKEQNCFAAFVDFYFAGLGVSTEPWEGPRYRSNQRCDFSALSLRQGKKTCCTNVNRIISSGNTRRNHSQELDYPLVASRRRAWGYGSYWNRQTGIFDNLVIIHVFELKSRNSVLTIDSTIEFWTYN